MTALEAYVLACKKAAGAVSGVSSMSINGTTLVINCEDGTILRMTFPVPADGKSVTSAKIENGHLILTLSDLTEIDAGELPSGGNGSGVLEEDLTTNVTVGGCPSGTKFTIGTSLETILRKVLIQEVAPTIKITINPVSGLFLKGTTRSLKYVISTISKGSAELISIDLWANADKIASLNCGTQTSYTYTLASPIDYIEDTDFKAELKYKMSNGLVKSVYSPVVSYKFCSYSYFGALTSLTGITSDNITGLEAHKVVGSKATSYSFTCEDKCLVYAYPKSFGKLSKIKDDNFELSWNVSEMNITDEFGNTEAYYIYTNGGKCEVSGYKVTFA